MFSITDGKGFGITFSNGWTLSVQFGYGNYCNNRRDRLEKPVNGSYSCANAECAAIAPGGEFVFLPGETDEVTTYSTPEDVAKFIAWVSSQPAKEPKPCTP